MLSVRIGLSFGALKVILPSPGLVIIEIYYDALFSTTGLDYSDVLLCGQSYLEK